MKAEEVSDVASPAPPTAESKAQAIDTTAEEDSDVASPVPPTEESEAQAIDTTTSSYSAADQEEIVRALAVVERDSLAIAQSFTSLFSSLRLALSQATSSSVDHMECFSDAAGRLQECALDAATKGNRYINSCLRLNEEMKGIDNLAAQLKLLRRNVDTLDSAVNKLLRLP